jgi:hypothetical protein
MKIHEVLEPGTTQDQEAQNLDDLLDRVEQECSGFFQEARKAGNWLYRGIASHTDRIFRGRSRHDRKPLHSNSKYSDMFDNLLTQCGSTALRSNSIFCSGRRQFAQGFGTPYLIFPINGHHTYTWTTSTDTILDTFVSLQATDQEKWSLWSDEWLTAIYNSTLSTYKKDKWLDLVNDYDAINSLVRQIAEQKPLLIDAGVSEQLVNIDLDTFLSVNEFRKNWQPQTNHMAVALEQGKEILINGEYYAFQARSYGGMIAQHWQIPNA